MDEKSVTPSNECVLKCTKVTKLFNFPSEDAIRTLWVYKLGLHKYEQTLQVCDRHFSHTNQSDIAIPDQNLPDNIEVKESYEKLIQKIMKTKKINSREERKVENKSPSGKMEAAPSTSEFHSTIIEEDSQSANRKQTLVENENLSTRIEEDIQTKSEDRILMENEFDEDSQSTSECREEIENIYSSLIEEDPQPTSEDMRETLSNIVEESSQTSITSEDMRLEENESSSIIIEEDSQTTNESGELTEKESSAIIEEDPQLVKVPPVTMESSADVSTSKSNLPLKTKRSLINDNSKLLLDYQLCIEGKYMCDVIEIPEYIVVISIPKAKEIRPVTLMKKTDLGPGKKKEKVRSLRDIPPSITITRTIGEEPIIPNKRKYRVDNYIVESQQSEEIDFVYYMAEDGNPRREREIQVDIETTTKESSAQCDVELDINMLPINYQSKLRPNPADLNKRECLVCGEILLNLSAQVRHTALHESNVPSLCPYCGARFTNPQKLIAHEKFFHAKSLMQIKKALRCPRLHCQKAFHSKKQLYNHIEEHIRKAGYKCHRCLRVFTSSLKLLSHQRTSKNCSKGKFTKSKMYLTKI